MKHGQSTVEPNPLSVLSRAHNIYNVVSIGYFSGIYNNH